MDFCKLLHKAQKNDKSNSNGSRYYSTKFEPPKKMKKETKDLSENIKKFLAKKEAEEQKKQEEAKKKKEELLALRAQDKKATRRVNVMLKRTKSANQSVLEEAVDNTHTALTRAGPDQPDEDDYGYVSQEASALYEKMMEKYSQMPEEPKFDMFKKKVSSNLSSTKDRVKAALEREREEAMQPRKRKRRTKMEIYGQNEEVKEEEEEEERSPERKDEQVERDKEVKDKPEDKPKPKPRPPAPPPMSFTELLKLAAQKQHEPILIEEKPQEKERLYTKKEQRELDKEREWRERRERRYNEMENNIRERHRDENSKGKSISNSSGPSSSAKPILKNALEKPLLKPTTSERPPSKSSQPGDRTPNKDRDRIPSKQVKFAGSESKSSSESFKKSSSTKPSSSGSSSSSSNAFKNEDSRTKNGDSSRPSKSSSSTSSSGSSSAKDKLPNSSVKTSVPSKSEMSRPSSVSSKPVSKPGLSKDVAKKSSAPQVASAKLSGKPKEFPPRDLLPKGKPKELPPRDLKPKQFPPPDVRGVKRKQLQISRGRILDDDDSEYDSEMDDFIDDEPEEGDYSNYIKEIFGYDKSRYRDLDDDVDNMESSFAQQMKEEVISTKIGIMEDLEDIKKEEEEKRRKAMLKKKMKR